MDLTVQRKHFIIAPLVQVYRIVWSSLEEGAKRKNGARIYGVPFFYYVKDLT